MVSLQGVPSALIARNESWVRQQAQRLVRRLPGNVEKADLIQVGLIAVAQTAVTFVWEGDRDSEEARAAFVRYAQARVKGAMLDELRQMDTLSRVQRRQLKVIEIARERWRASNGAEPGLAQLSALCHLDIDEIAGLEALAAASRSANAATGNDDESDMAEHQMLATERDEVEARVDTAIVFRRLEAFFAQLPERERTVIEAYLGVGLTLADAAKSLKVSPSRVSQIYAEVLKKASKAIGMGHEHRALDRVASDPNALDAMVAQRERELAASGPNTHNNWGELLQQVLEPGLPAPTDDGERIVVGPGTRWG